MGYLDQFDPGVQELLCLLGSSSGEGSAVGNGVLVRDLSRQSSYIGRNEPFDFVLYQQVVVDGCNRSRSGE